MLQLVNPTNWQYVALCYACEESQYNINLNTSIAAVLRLLDGLQYHAESKGATKGSIQHKTLAAEEMGVKMLSTDANSLSLAECTDKRRRR